MSIWVCSISTDSGADDLEFFAFANLDVFKKWLYERYDPAKIEADVAGMWWTVKEEEWTVDIRGEFVEILNRWDGTPGTDGTEP